MSLCTLVLRKDKRHYDVFILSYFLLDSSNFSLQNVMALQMEGSKKKKEKDKVLEALEVELATAYSHESKAAEDLKIARGNHSKFKVTNFGYAGYYPTMSIIPIFS